MHYAPHVPSMLHWGQWEDYLTTPKQQGHHALVLLVMGQHTPGKTIGEQEKGYPIATQVSFGVQPLAILGGFEN